MDNNDSAARLKRMGMLSKTPTFRAVELEPRERAQKCIASLNDVIATLYANTAHKTIQNHCIRPITSIPPTDSSCEQADKK